MKRVTIKQLPLVLEDIIWNYLNTTKLKYRHVIDHLKWIFVTIKYNSFGTVKLYLQYHRIKSKRRRRIKHSLFRKSPKLRLPPRTI